MGMHNNKLQMVHMNFISIFLRSSSAILVPGMMGGKASTTKSKTRLFKIRLTVTNNTNHPDDLDTRKSTGTSCQIEIHFMIKTTEYLL